VRPSPFRTDAAEAFSYATLAIKIGLIALGALILIRVAGILVQRLERAIRVAGRGDEISREKRARTLGGIVRGVARLAIIVVALMMAVRELGLDITPALAAAGGFGVAAGLGAQSVIRDWIVGFFIVYDNEYVVGDVVSVAGVTGTVESLTLRHTEVRDGEGALHFVPNGEIKVVTNLTKAWSSPIVRIPVSLAEDPARVTSILESYLAEAAERPPLKPLLRDAPRVLGMEDVSAGQYTMMLQARTLPEHRLAVARALRFGAVTRLRDEGIAVHSALAPAEAAAPRRSG
jgi:small conductance mechanosensitive channel